MQSQASFSSNPTYRPAPVERKWRETWKREAAFAPAPPAPGRGSRYIYACTPFTTGKAHMGHVRSYTIADVCARRARAQGHAVLWAMGFDAFGLPNEMAAIEHAVPPRDWVAASRKTMTHQFEQLGLSVDPQRCFVTSEPDYYRWTQWVFLRFLERGLVYRAEGVENWCDHCQCVLAALQVGEDGRCWRCDGETRLACIPQWYMRLTPYAAELEAGLEALVGWDEAVLACQRTLFGRTDGRELDLTLPSGETIAVFVPDGADPAEAAFVALSPNHPRIRALARRDDLDFEGQRRRSLRREERSARHIDGVRLDAGLRVPGLDRELPVVVSPAVDMRFGGGAALGFPGRDAVDAALARQLDLSPRASGHAASTAPLRPAVRYRLRDNSISRQRSWGAPIPIIHCARCGEVPVPDADLPVRLPDDLVPTGEGSALAAHPRFAACACPRCGGAGRRDTDTLDVHMDSIWMLLPFCVPAADRDARMFTHPDLERWLPVSQVVCGADQAGWWMNDRLFFKVMRDCGYLRHLPDGEPVTRLLMHEMVLADGRKMSKSLGNAVDPDEVIGRWGADVVRLAVLKVNPRKAFNWTDEALEENYAFLSGLWSFIAALPPADNGAPIKDDPTTDDPGRRRLRRWRTTAGDKADRAYERQAFHLVQKELKVFFGLIQRFAAAGGGVKALKAADAAAAAAALDLLVGLLEPLAPHIGAELKSRLAARSSGEVQALKPPPFVPAQAAWAAP